MGEIVWQKCSKQITSSDVIYQYDLTCREREDQLIHWCHGAPGVVHLYIQMYHKTRDEKYLEVEKVKISLRKWELLNFSKKIKIRKILKVH